MENIIRSDTTSIEVTVSVKISSVHVSFAKEIRDRIGTVAAIRYLHHVYPDFSLSTCKGIVEHYLD